jgi:hypothetical protein
MSKGYKVSLLRNGGWEAAGIYEDKKEADTIAMSAMRNGQNVQVKEVPLTTGLNKN